MAYTKQNFEDGQVLKAEHLNNMEQGIERVSKMVVEQASDTLTWDGNTDGRTMVDLGDGAYMVHVSNSVPTLADFANGGSCTQNYPGGSANVPFSSDTAMDVGSGSILASTMFFCVVPEDNTDLEGFVFPNKGVYLLCSPSEGVCFTSITINGYAGFVADRIDENFLPGTVILYADSQKYLYADSDISDTSKRITKAEIKAFFESGRSIIVAVPSENSVAAYCSIGAVILLDTYATVYSLDSYSATGVVTATKYYTAERTAS